MILALTLASAYPAAAVDLTVAAISASPPTVPLGSTVTVESTVAASGGGAVNGFYVHYYLSTDPTITTSDVVLGNRHLSAGLKDGESSTATLTFSPPTSISGTYYVGAIVDTTSQVSESDETNNALAGPVITITKPDLVVTAVSATPATVPLGSPLTVTDTVTCAGGKASNTIYVKYYLSSDPTITTSDVPLGNRYLSAGLKDGESSTATLAFSPPTSISGTYYVGAIVDATSQVSESDETNNALAGPVITITKPDLVVTALTATPTTVPLGSSLTVTDSVTVTGGKTLSSFYVRYYLSTDPVITASDISIGSRSIGAAMTPGQSNSATTTLSPSTSITGTYYVGAIVDSTYIDESDETNNAITGPVITITKPDLVVTALTATPTTVPLGSLTCPPTLDG
ncbi:CARDB domain-containing protein [Anaeromyxobacter dehalogenans]|uniref:CARDB domain-containing protein n=1 Tax=Anaeromyxobacter dehalogenans TaxID=161493 RepID=UPI00059E5A52|nr:CARDB domain-containing protein [Anaeromyxobacter dehalogenans]